MGGGGANKIPANELIPLINIFAYIVSLEKMYLLRTKFKISKFGFL
jgi:hypothetical protein